MSRRPAIPAPAHPTERREPLPWEQPKATGEEAEAEAHLSAIMRHPSYAEADRDVDFLHTDATRGMRLQLDYLKTEQGLASRDIRHCIVIFGSTRLREPETARNELAAAHREAAAHPGDAVREKAVRLAERRMELARYYEVGRELGRLVGEAARRRGDSRLAVMTGGGPGGMEAANRGAFEAGADTVGLNITLPREQYPNPYLTPGLCFQFHYFALRKLHFMKRAAAIVALPGGYGTLDELFGALTLIQTRKTAPIPIVLVGEAYWRNVFNVDFLVDSGSIAEEDRELFWYAESAQQAWDGIRAWHELNGSSLFDGELPED
ncbi:MAG: LOG family protein [Acidihalobacter sp.]|uniref:LOG family protein n=1 Tax=Acidihalobacter sp. TaxID=1872108 RepID=UPI00307CD5A1